jgi:Flp pilus assembly protein TadB
MTALTGATAPAGAVLATNGVASDVWPGLGLAGAIVLGALILATLLLWLNMRRQLRRINVPTEAELREQDRAARKAQAAHDSAAPGPREQAERPAD